MYEDHFVSTAAGPIRTSEPIFLSSDASSKHWIVRFSVGKEQPEVYDGSPECQRQVLTFSKTEVKEAAEQLRSFMGNYSILPNNIVQIINNSGAIFYENAEIYEFSSKIVNEYIPSISDLDDALPVIKACIDKIDTLFNTELRKVLMQNVIFQNLDRDWFLKLCIEEFDMFTEEEQIGLVNILYSRLTNGVINTELIDSCIYNTYIMECKTFTDLFVQGLIDKILILNDDQLLEFIEKSEKFTLETQIKFAYYLMAEMEIILSSKSLEYCKDVIIYIIKYMQDKELFQEVLKKW